MFTVLYESFTVTRLDPEKSLTHTQNRMPFRQLHSKVYNETYRMYVIHEHLKGFVETRERRGYRYTAPRKLLQTNCILKEPQEIKRCHVEKSFTNLCELTYSVQVESFHIGPRSTLYTVHPLGNSPLQPNTLVHNVNPHCLLHHLLRLSVETYL